MRVLVFALVVLGCTYVFEPSEDWTEFAPPAQYRTWHGEVEICLGARRAFDDLTWRKVYAPAFFCGDVSGAYACFAYPSTIYLAEPVVSLAWAVKAEVIHYIRGNGLHDSLALHCATSDP